MEAHTSLLLAVVAFRHIGKVVLYIQSDSDCMSISKIAIDYFDSDLPSRRVYRNNVLQPRALIAEILVRARGSIRDANTIAVLPDLTVIALD